MKPISNRYSTLCSLVLTLLSVASSIFVLTACQGKSTYHVARPSFSLSRGKIYVQYTNTTDDSNDSLAVFRADTGTFLWKESNVIDTPVEDATTVYVPTKTTLIAKDGESGGERWHTAEELYPSAVINGIVYARTAINDPAISFSALRADNGKLLWTTTLPNTDAENVQQVEMEQDRVYVFAGSSFFVLQARDGKIIWSSPAHAATRANGMIYLSRWQKAGDGIVDAVRAEDGKRLWSFHPPTPARVPDLITSIATSDGILSVNTVDTLYGLRIRDGALLWSLSGKSIGEFTQPILTADGVLYIPSLDEGLLAIQARDGTERWRFHPGEEVSSIGFDSTSGILYTTIDPAPSFTPTSVVAVQTNGQVLLKMQPQRTDSDPGVLEANGVIYQVLSSESGGGDIFLEPHYTQVDLTATRGSDGKSLWLTHFPF